MNGKMAQQLALELLNAGILIQATVQPAVRPQQPYARRHEGHAAIWGVWAFRGEEKIAIRTRMSGGAYDERIVKDDRPPKERMAIIGCAHVAEALVAAGKWTVEAIRACHHTAPGQDPEADWPRKPNLTTIRYSR